MTTRADSRRAHDEREQELAQNFVLGLAGLATLPAAIAGSALSWLVWRARFAWAAAALLGLAILFLLRHQLSGEVQAGLAAAGQAGSAADPTAKIEAEVPRVSWRLGYLVSVVVVMSVLGWAGVPPSSGASP
jgi:hypothetical protein